MYQHSYIPTLHILKKKKILKRLGSSKYIAILLPDKESLSYCGRVILKRDDYIKKIFDYLILLVTLLSSKKVSTDPTLLR